jgi:hypothetical protein
MHEENSTIEGTVELNDVKPWEKFKNPKIRREQEFLQTRDTRIGARIEMSDTIYEVTKAGWRKI